MIVVPLGVINLPSRTAAIIPHPQEQKLHEFVNSLTFDSLRVAVLDGVAPLQGVVP